MRGASRYRVAPPSQKAGLKKRNPIEVGATLTKIPNFQTNICEFQSVPFFEAVQKHRVSTFCKWCMRAGQICSNIANCARGHSCRSSPHSLSFSTAAQAAASCDCNCTGRRTASRENTHAIIEEDFKEYDRIRVIHVFRLIHHDPSSTLFIL